MSPWEQGFKTYVNKIKQTNEPFEELIKNETYFREKFTQFLYSPRGGIFQVNISPKRLKYLCPSDVDPLLVK